jgi:hypothetical protein
MNKKGEGVGKTMVGFVATIIIFLLLLGFVFLSGVIMDFFSAKNEESFRNEELLGVEDGEEYMEGYNDILAEREPENTEAQELNWSLINLRR